MDSVTLELRPRIRSCNVFIAMKNSTEAHDVKLKLTNNTANIKLDDDVYEIDLGSLIIIPETLSSLAVSGKWISFRVQTTPAAPTAGRFSVEVIDAQEIENNSFQNGELEAPPRHTKLTISCKCCKNMLIEAPHTFKRVLSLPSEDCDPTAWFCCSQSPYLDVKNLLTPGENDYFYGPHYCVLNKNIICNNYKIIVEDIVCNKCSTVLGVNNSRNADDAFKFWNNSLELASASSPIVYYNITSPWCDFKSACLNYINESSNSEIIFYAIDQNYKYLLFIKAMERKLCLYTNLTDSESTKTIKLERNFVTKVLYKYGKTEITTKTNQLDRRICQISVQSIIASIDNLVLSSQKIPPIYRMAGVSYNVGYVL